MEASINMRVFKTMLMVITLAAVGVQANPLLHYRDRDSRPEHSESASLFSKKDPPVEHYDQRQNGTENYRVKVDGLVFILAPADSLLLAGAALDPNFSSQITDINKPRPKPEKEENLKPLADKEESSKSVNEPTHIGHKSVLRISNLIAPFLHRIHHPQQNKK